MTQAIGRSVSVLTHRRAAPVSPLGAFGPHGRDATMATQHMPVCRIPFVDATLILRVDEKTAC
ncbi:hypothetical protein ACLBYD_29335 [Rhodococcus sp. C26F]